MKPLAAFLTISTVAAMASVMGGGEEPTPAKKNLYPPSLEVPAPSTVTDPRQYAYDPTRDIIVRVDPHLNFEPQSPR